MSKTTRMSSLHLLVHSCNKRLGTLRLSDGTRMSQIYYFLCLPQHELEVKNRNGKVLLLVIAFLL